MRITEQEIQMRLERIRHATHTNFPFDCADLFAYLDDKAPDNAVLKELRQSGSDSSSGSIPRGWQMPVSKEARARLTYYLFRRIAESGERGHALLHSQYHQRRPQDNVNAFRNDFLPHLGDILAAILAAEPRTIVRTGREKQQKFGILDAPGLLKEDLDTPPGLFGRAVIYFDLDDFKSVNTRFTERVVDDAVLPEIHRLVDRAVQNQGFVYAEGGDEMIALLPNATLAMGVAFAEALREALLRHEIDIQGKSLRVRASFGVAAGFEGASLADDANKAKKFAKTNGKDCIAIIQDECCQIWAPPIMKSTSD